MNYARAFAAFEAWAGAPLRPPDIKGELEDLLREYMDSRYLVDKPAHKAVLEVTPVLDKWPQFGSGKDFSQVQRALRGYRKAVPPRSPAPIAAELMAGMVNVLMTQGQVITARLVATLLFPYCRPGELRKMI